MPSIGSRQGLKKSVLESTRRSMTERRIELKHQIRKSKRQELVSLKRRLNTASSSSGAGGAGGYGVASAATQKLVGLVNRYVSTASSHCLSDLQACISGGDVHVSHVDSILEDNIDLSGSVSFQLCETLSRSLVSPSVCLEDKLNACRVLTNLGAGESFTADDYYGGDHCCAKDIGWCGVMLRSSVVGALVSVVQGFIAGVGLFGVPDNIAIGVAVGEQACWALGNLAGDSERARDVLRECGAIGVLVAALRRGLQIGKVESGTTANGTICLCRNAAWALSNLARGADTSALLFLDTNAANQDCQMPMLTEDNIAPIATHESMDIAGINNNIAGSGTLLTTHDIIELLSSGNDISCPEEHQHIDVSSNKQSIIELPTAHTTWLEVANETCWILAFLTAREDAAVDYLCTTNTTTPTTTQSLPQTLNTLLNHAISLSKKSLIIPCLRVFGNIATSCDGRHVPALLNSSSSPNLSQILAKLLRTINNKQNNNTIVPIVTEAAWVTGTILCDVGVPNHPATTTNCPDILVPALCTVITRTNNLDCQREALRALWNALAPPPSSHETLITTQSSKLCDIFKTITQNHVVLETLVTFLLRPDTDIVYTSLRIIDAILRRFIGMTHDATTNNHPIVILLQESRILDALDAICDRASSTVSGYGMGWDNIMEKTADLAADLIDDYFGQDSIF